MTYTTCAALVACLSFATLSCVYRGGKTPELTAKEAESIALEDKYGAHK